MLGEEHLPKPLSNLISGLQFFSQVLGYLTRAWNQLPGQPVNEKDKVSRSKRRSRIDNILPEC